ncbi:MAG: radical SAM protein [Spirochaetaceae bacterium]|nr:MAG: radical SAM protein [Spirochaetaceae bacterium]
MLLCLQGTSMSHQQTARTGEVYPFSGGEFVLYKTDRLERLYIELTNRCNFSCRMCFRNNFSGAFGTMPDRVIDALLEQIAVLPRLKSALVGGIGEPLMHSRFREVITALKRRGAIVDVQTNGVLLDDDLIDFLLQQDVDRIITSYECAAVGHVQATGLKRTIARIAELRQKRRGGWSRANHPRITLEWILTADTLDRLESEAREMVALGVNEFILSNLLPMEESMAADSLIMSQSTGRADRVAWQNQGDILEPFIDALRYRAKVQRPEFHLRTERWCSFIERNAMVIRHDGEVTPCYRLLHDSREFYQGRWRDVLAHSFGNIADGSALEIWNSRDYLRFRHQVRNKLYPSCPDCELRDGCDYIQDSSADCYANSPSCGDCLWDRRILICP